MRDSFTGQPANSTTCVAALAPAVSSQNLFPSVPQRLLVAGTTSAGVAGALVIELVSYQAFLLLLGSFFVPLFAVLLADWLVAGRRYDEVEVFGAPAWRPGLVAAWILGFALYQWLAPTGPGWWVELVERLHPPSWDIGATIPSFLVSFALSLALSAAARSWSAPRATA